MKDYVDTFNLELDLAGARLTAAQLHRMLGRFLNAYPNNLSVEQATEARRLYDSTVLPTPDWGQAVVIGTRRADVTWAIRTRLVHAGLTAKAADRVARQPLTMPVKLAPGVIISVFDLPAEVVEEAS